MTISNVSSKGIVLIVNKFHLQPPGTKGTKIYSNYLDHLINMAAMPINDNKLFFCKTNGLMASKLDLQRLELE